MLGYSNLVYNENKWERQGYHAFIMWLTLASSRGLRDTLTMQWRPNM